MVSAPKFWSSGSRAVVGAAFLLLAGCSPAPTATAPIPSPTAASQARPSPSVARLVRAYPAPPSSAERVRVLRVVDGDTFIGQFPSGAEDRVRLIGVDSPEAVQPNAPVECFGPAASEYARGRIEGKVVLTAMDVSETDRFGRRLRYVWFSENATTTFLNAELVLRGYARASAFPPDIAHERLLGELEREARASGAGLWNACR